MSFDRQHSVNPWVVTFSVMLATFMEILDTTVVNVSIPHIAGNLSADVDEGTWALTSLSGWWLRLSARRRLRPE